ncbi:major facilitator super transporter protein [Gryganskiella cystojenkinii]|nr:major facilitator super transporter protein [Gryganskiella cystojenkinii]
MRPWALYGALLASLACQLVGLVMFAKGFFPYKSISTSFASLEDLPPLPMIPTDQDSDQSDRASGAAGTIPPRFGKVVLMLVDALRSDFLYGNESDFTFMQSLIENNKAIPFTALASAPTVTLPRLKALTTGTVPGFLDAILNIAESDQSSTLANQDNWILQLTRAATLRMDTSTVDEKRNVGFFGDDTWIKLFPELFFRTDGTSSFFAMDTVEVDNNVTRHVIPELRKEDWDGLIFHYLGLDHVGHSGGPKSLLMRPKQAEMDDVARTIYSELLNKAQQGSPEELPTLFILCGDHGMNEIQKMVDPFRESSVRYSQLEREEYEYYKSVNQVDLVPTLSLLLGLPIPKNSVGKVIPELFSSYSESEKLRALQINGHQVAGVLKAMWSDFETESSELLRDYQDQAEDEVDEGSATEREERCSGGTEKERLACWYRLALAEHASYLEMIGQGRQHKGPKVIYQPQDVTRKFQAAERAYAKFLTDSSQMLSTALSKYDMALLTNGSMMMAFAVIGLMFCAMQTRLLEEFKISCRQTLAPSSRPNKLSLFTTGSSMSSLVKGAFLSSGSTPRRLHLTRNEVNWTPVRFLSGVIVVLYMITLFASSFVEEEHQFWYFFNMSWFAVLAWVSARYVDMDGSSSSTPSRKWRASGLCLLQMGILRLLRAWNQTGQKYADQIDLRHYLNSTYLDISWVLFWGSMVTLAAVLIAAIYYVPSSAQTVGRAGIIKLLQSLSTIVVVLISLWITVYKMDLEEKHFGESTMTTVHGFMSTLSPVGYQKRGGPESPLVFSGFEIARGCYAGLLLLVGLAIALQLLGRSTQATRIVNKEDLVMAPTLFLPGMLLGATTLLMILLSRRHQAPIFILFGIQLWMYLEWTRLVRWRSRDMAGGVKSEVESSSSHDKLIVEEEEVSDDQNPSSTHDNDDSIPPFQLHLRSLPGLTSIHSCTILIWTLTSFFLLGNSNSIASIDISNAYVGIQAYDISLTGVLTFLSNWAGPIWWTIAGTVVVLRWDLVSEEIFVAGDEAWHRAIEDEKKWKTVHGWRKTEGKKVLTRRTKRRILWTRQVVAAAKAASDSIVTAAAPLLDHDGKAEMDFAPHSDVLRQGDLVGEEHPQTNTTEDDDDPDSFIVYEETAVSSDTPATSSSSSRISRLPWLKSNRLLEHLILTSLFFGLSLYCLSIAAIVLRHHLFIWTVFSPKVLYQMAWTVLFQLGVQVLVIGGLSLLLAS